MKRTPIFAFRLPFLEWGRRLNRRTLRADLMAGLTGMVVAIPQGVAFAMIAGLPPEYGLYTGIVMPVVTALFGSSHHMVTAPTTVVSILLFAAVSKQGVAEGSAEFVAMAITLTFLVGVIQLALGLVRIGSVVNFVSQTVVIGFTAGSGILIGASQLKHVLGIELPTGLPFYRIFYELGRRIDQLNWQTVAVGMGTLVIAVIFKKLWRKSPYMLFAMVGGSLIAAALGGEAAHIPFVGAMPSQLPQLILPELSIDRVTQLLPDAFAIALIGLIGAVAIARSIALDSGQKIDGNQEFIGQGLANLIGSFLQCHTGSGSFTRSGVNFQSGAQTPLSSIIASVLLIIVVLFVAPLSAYLPIPAMGGLILLVGYNLVDVSRIRQIMRTSRYEAVVLWVTLASTLFLDLQFAIYVGVIFSLLFYLKQTARPKVECLVPDVASPRHRFVNVKRLDEPHQCPQLQIVRIDGSLYYGAIESIADRFDQLRREAPRNVLIVANSINFIDLAGVEWLHQETARWRARGGDLFVSGLKQNAEDVLLQSGYKSRIGLDHFFEKKGEAITRIYSDFLDPAVCRACTSRIFQECATAPMDEKSADTAAFKAVKTPEQE